MGIKLIQAQVLNTSAASVTFSNIPQQFKSLKLLISSKRDLPSGTGCADIYFNGSQANLSSRILEASGSSVSSSTPSTGMYGQAGENSEAGWASAEISIPNYSGSTNKPFSSDAVREANATTAYSDLVAGLWSNTAAITSITVKPEDSSSKWVIGSSFYLYGVY